MTRLLPESLNHGTNQRVLAYLADKSAHSDLAEALMVAIRPLGDVQLFCPDPAKYKYLIVSTKDVIFGFAAGMHATAFRLSPTFRERALGCAADDRQELGPGWVSFEIFRSDWPQVDLAFWARKAYVFARDPGTP